MTSEERGRAIRDKIRTAKEIAKLKLFQDLMQRMARGDKLNATELKLFRELDQHFEGDENGKGEAPALFHSMDEAAEYCGISKRTISYHLKRGNISQNTDGTFERAVLDKWLADNGRKPATGSKDTEQTAKAGRPKRKKRTTEEKKELADLEFRRWRARRERILTEQLEQTLISQKDVAAGWATRVVVVTAGLEAFADRLPPLLMGRSVEEMRQIIKREVWVLRDGYAREGKFCPTQAEETVEAELLG